jgi:hypothetical protein
MNTFVGDWQSTFGPMNLAADGDQVRGVYHYMGVPCTIEGTLADGKLTFTYREPTVAGEGWFELRRNGQAFAGQYRPDGDPKWDRWEGERIGFDGLWNSSFGLLRMIEEGDHVRGFYEAGGQATITGRREDGRLVFTYQEPQVGGQGRFELAADGLSFQGEWKPDAEENWRPWSGLRVRPQPNLTWLVVIEAPWQRFLSEREYAFGNMLREFFARIDNVQVRHRYFSNEAGLRKCCRDLRYIAEPVVLVLATHAKPEGITVDGQTIGIPALLEDLSAVGNLQLVHFSACLLMQDPQMLEVLGDFARRCGLAVSGYRTSVDWAESAIIEFTYLDLILGRGLAPLAAADQLTKLLPFAGDQGEADTPFPPAGFVIVAP